MKTKEKVKFHNNTVYTKNSLITCILILKTIKKDTIIIDDDIKDLVSDIRYILNNIIMED